LKQDLRVSASNLAKSGSETKDVAVKQVKQLLSEGAGVMNELERVTRHLAGSAKHKVSEQAGSRSSMSDSDDNDTER
jgi:hypothetical protein